MLRFCILIFFLVATGSLFAHQPDKSSTMLVEKEDGKWVLQVRAALTAFEYEVKHAFGKGSYNSPEEFEALVMEHLRNRIDLTIDEQTYMLGTGSVQLGHKTNVLFEIENEILELNKISVSQKSFADINRNQSALVLLKKGLKPQQFILDQSNGHQMTLECNDDHFVPKTLVSAGVPAHSHLWQYSIAVVLTLLIGFFGWKWLRNHKAIGEKVSIS